MNPREKKVVDFPILASATHFVAQVIICEDPLASATSIAKLCDFFIFVSLLGPTFPPLHSNPTVGRHSV